MPGVNCRLVSARGCHSIVGIIALCLFPFMCESAMLNIIYVGSDIVADLDWSRFVCLLSDNPLWHSSLSHKHIFYSVNIVGTCCLPLLTDGHGQHRNEFDLQHIVSSMHTVKCTSAGLSLQKALNILAGSPSMRL